MYTQYVLTTSANTIKAWLKSVEDLILLYDDGELIYRCGWSEYASYSTNHES